MILDAMFKFATTAQALSGTSDVASTNVHDAGSAKLLFGGFSQRPPLLMIIAEWQSGTSATIRGRLVGADDAVLTTNPVVIADTGVILVADDGTAFASGHAVAARQLAARGQRTAKRYYGVMWTQGGSSPVFNVKAFIVADPQTKDLVAKAAVP